jgi:hypothetical protein
MSDHRFDYPTAAAPTSSRIFTQGARLAGDTPALKLMQETGLTTGGTRRTKNYGDAKHVWPLTVIFYTSHATLVDFDDMLTWIEDVAEGAVNSFEWTDENAVVRTVKIINDDFTFPKFGHDTQSCTLQLEEV